MNHINTVLTTILVGSALLLTDGQRQRSSRELVDLLGQGSRAYPNTHIVFIPQGASGIEDVSQKSAYAMDSALQTGSSILTLELSDIQRRDEVASPDADSNSVVTHGIVRSSGGSGGSNALLAMVLTYGGPTQWWRGQSGTGTGTGAGTGNSVGNSGNSGNMDGDAEREVAEVNLDTYIRIGIDATFTENIPGVKKEVMKQAMHTFLRKFFVYEAEGKRVVFAASKMKYEDVERLYKNLQESKNGLGKAATAKIPLLNLRLHEDPLGDSVDEFLRMLCEPESNLYKLFVDCTVGVVGHMQQHLKGDLGVDVVAFEVDAGGDIVPTTFVSTLCGLSR